MRNNIFSRVDSDLLISDQGFWTGGKTLKSLLFFNFVFHIILKYRFKLKGLATLLQADKCAELIRAFMTGSVQSVVQWTTIKWFGVSSVTLNRNDWEDRIVELSVLINMSHFNWVNRTEINVYICLRVSITVTNVSIFSRDNGGGKTRLAFVFAFSHEQSIRSVPITITKDDEKITEEWKIVRPLFR